MWQNTHTPDLNQCIYQNMESMPFHHVSVENINSLNGCSDMTRPTKEESPSQL